jgi:DNA invertase Pin-like site-specific DNA recombinase
VQADHVPFKTILVYDISRWGRFQDSDESAFYEYTCRRAGINVEYCAEQFENDGSPVSTIIKSVKRAMAGEYSRELSNKVFKGQCRLIQLGYRQGGPAGFGLRRMLVDQNGSPKGLLKRGEHKSLQTDRVILVPGPEDEVVYVRRIYELFTRGGMKEGQIAEWLNGQGVRHTELDRAWSGAMVREVLTNEKYIGNNVFNRISFKLKKKRVRNTPEMWVRGDRVFKPIVDEHTFYVARGIFLERARRFSDEELLEKLRGLYAKHGTLSAALIDGADDVPSSSVYQCRFGNLLAAYERVGFRPDRDFQYVEINRNLRQLRVPLLRDVLVKLGEIGASISQDDDSGVLLINGQYTVGFVMTRCRQTPSGTLRWLIDFSHRPISDVTVVVRMDAANQQAVDFFLLPKIGMLGKKLRLGEANAADVETYRFDTLGYLVGMAARADAEAVA